MEGPFIFQRWDLKGVERNATEKQLQGQGRLGIGAGNLIIVTVHDAVLTHGLKKGLHYLVLQTVGGCLHFFQSPLPANVLGISGLIHTLGKSKLKGLVDRDFLLYYPKTEAMRGKKKNMFVFKCLL